MKEKLKKIFVEVPTIVLSVIIALAINEWNNQREREHLAGNVVAAIREEIEFNRSAVKKAVDYHIPLVGNLMNDRHRIFSVPLQRLRLSAINAEQLQKQLTALFEQMGEVLEQPLVVKRTDDSTYRIPYKNRMLTLRIQRDTVFLFGRGNISLRSALIKNNAWKIAQAAQIAPYLDFRLIALMSEVDQMQNQYEATTKSIIDMLYRGGSDVTPAMQDMLEYEKRLLQQYDQLLEILERP